MLDCNQPPEEDLQPILREEVEIAVASLKRGKSSGVDNIPAELVQAGGETMIDVLTEICNRIWRTGKWPTPWIQSLIFTLHKKGNLQLCQNYRTISLISHSSKVMLEVILYYILFYPITLEGRRGTTDEFATIPFHFVLFSAALVELAKSIPVHSLILSSHLFFCPSLFLFPFTVPCRIVFAKPEDLETWPNHLNFRS